MNGLDAYLLSMANKNSKWPDRLDPGNRLHPDCEPSFKTSFKLRSGESIFTIGSCFARNIERHLQKLGYNIPALAFSAPESEGYPGPISNVLNKYSPQGMLNEVMYAIHGKSFHSPEDFLVEGLPDQISDYQLHVRGVVNRTRALQRRSEVRRLFAEAISASRVFIITLGLVEAWLDLESDLYLNDAPSFNMCKRYKDRFNFEVLTYEKCFAAVKSLIDALYEAKNGDLNIILTVSPVPLQRTFADTDAIAANCLSKSLLRSVASAITQSFDFVDYFPSYESVIYSDNQTTWLDDQVHVSDVRVERIIHRMSTAYCS